jgi:HAD superfamily hydrolase (TIGR01484 family)
MQQFNPLNEIRPSILATDLDGTFIPLVNNAANRADLLTLNRLLESNNINLIFVTGRPFPSVMRVMKSANLPLANWILCDVGTSIYRKANDNDYQAIEAYHQHLEAIVSKIPRQLVVDALHTNPDIGLQSEENQCPHKISYQCDAAKIDLVISAIDRMLERDFPVWQALASMDPFDGRGLIDILPYGASKAHGLLWLAQHAQLDPSAIIFAGDSGNDLAALTAGFRAIVVGNANPKIAQAVHQKLSQRNLNHRLYIAKRHATSGVLEGLQSFLNN